MRLFTGNDIFEGLRSDALFSNEDSVRDPQEDTGFGGLNGGNIKIAPPNRFARLRTFSCNCQFEKPQTLFLEKSLVFGRKWIFFGGGKY